MIGDTQGWSALDPRVKQLWTVAGIVSAIVLPLIVLAGDAVFFRRIPWWQLPIGGLSLGMFLVLLPLNLWLVGKKFAAWRYRLREEDLSVAYGVYWQTRRYVNRARIQHVDVTAGPVARALGIAEVQVFVGGQMGPVASIPGLSVADADRLRQTLVRLDAPPVIDRPRGEGQGG